MLKSIKLIMVAVNSGEDVSSGKKAAQNNKFYNMDEKSDGTFIATHGRIDSTQQSTTYPMSKWDSIYKQKTKRGYKDVTELFIEGQDGSSDDSAPQPIPDNQINGLFNSLQQYANNSVLANYTISSSKVTQLMVDKAQQCIDEIVNAIQTSPTISDINAKLLDLYHIIPRKMDNVKNFIIPVPTSGDTPTPESTELANKLLANEQSTLDVMAGQVIIKSNSSDSEPSIQEKRTILDILGISVDRATADDIDTVKTLLGPNVSQFRNAYRITHHHTQKRFDEALAKSKNQNKQLFWHGSRNQNWLNIISTGLMIRPAGAIHTGSMFGDGIYFANKSQKSIGYTSINGSYWSKGGDSTAYLALFDVHVGEQMHIHKHSSYCYSLSKSVLDKDNYDSVYAHGGIDLRNDEFIVYQSHQCTISLLVEISD